VSIVKAWMWIVLALLALVGVVLFLRRSSSVKLPSSTGGGAAPHSQSQAASIASAIAGTATIFKAGASIFDDIKDIENA
jgi:purine-cytosine permease-like protein